MSNLLTRAISGLIYALAILSACFGGPAAQIALASVITVFAVLEWMRIGRHKVHWATSLLIMFAIFISIYTFSGIFDVNYVTTQVCRGLLAMSFVAIFLVQAFQKDTGSRRLFHTSFALLYIGVPMILLPMVGYYHGEEQPWVLASVFVLIWCNDSFAYLLGSAIGKHKIFPRISPNKTWEGFLGGVVSTVLAAVIFHHYLPIMPFWGWLGLALVVLIFGTLGDLFESAIKRSYNIKDSGKFMPGHGGILDRIDSLLFALPMAYFYLSIIENLH
jgi:phosphatidate cytidylyltransferase